MPARIWLIRTDGSGNRALRDRQSDQEGWGHEFWLPDGRNMAYDLWTSRNPLVRKRFLAITHIETRAEKRYPFEDDRWCVHFTVSHDGKRFAGDGSARHPTLFLIRLEGDQARFEMLCGVPKNDYSRTEPNVHFTPDGSGVIYTSNESGADNLYMVQL